MSKRSTTDGGSEMDNDRQRVICWLSFDRTAGLAILVVFNCDAGAIGNN